MNEFVAQLKDDQAAEGAQSARQSERLPDEPTRGAFSLADNCARNT